MQRISGIIFLVLLSTFGQTQVNPKDSSVFAPLVNVHYSFQLPQSDLSERFGWSSAIGSSVMFKTRSNWLCGLDGAFMFGDNVKDTTILDPISTSNGSVIDINGEYARIFLYERGFTAFVRGGKLFPVLGPNPNSGPFITAGIGFFQHKIRIEVTGNTAAQLQGEYKKGYDRLTSGVALSEFIGYRYFGNQRLINFFGGVEFMQAFTRNRRGYNYDLQSSDTDSRLDQLIGFRVGWTLPIYKKIPREIYYH